MKKWLLAVIFLIAYCSSCYANYTVMPTFTYQTGLSSATTIIISVSTTTVTQLDNPQVTNRVATEIDNIDSLANLWCVIGSSSAPTVPAANSGRKIAAGNSWIVSFIDKIYSVSTSTPNMNAQIITPINFWCVSDSTTTSTSKAAVTQLY